MFTTVRMTFIQGKTVAIEIETTAMGTGVRGRDWTQH